jgi:predicted RNA binding protein YcfA (HicA-like mRNA interferase family)
MEALARVYRRAGWDITLTRGGHLRWRSPKGGLVISPSTPSDHRSLRNLRSDLRRAERSTTP